MGLFLQCTESSSILSCTLLVGHSSSLSSIHPLAVLHLLLRHPGGGGEGGGGRESERERQVALELQRYVPRQDVVFQVVVIVKENCPKDPRGIGMLCRWSGQL